MKPPSITWQEHVAPDEAERFERYEQMFVEMQQRRVERFGPGRSLHRRGLLALRGTFEVLPKLPLYAQQGLFARPQVYSAWIRFSNGGPDRLADKKPDVRGFAIKILDVHGPSALGGGNTTSQDFLLINHEVFSSATSEPFVELLAAAERGFFPLLGYLITKYGFFGAFGQMRRLMAIADKPFSGFATERFFTAAPFACGPYAVRARLLPASDVPFPFASEDWAADIQTRLADGPLEHRFQIQFFTDEETTPIEDASVNWSESEAPYVTVAKLKIDQIGSNEAFVEEIERATFDPWTALKDHRPLGEIMRARKVAYLASQKERAVG